MTRPKYDGILNVDKPYGLTSMDVVRRLKRASGQKRVGHGGTLDPIATGVIPICFGQATRMMEELINGSKRYRAAVELGVVTDTYDALGEIVETRDASAVTLADIEEAINGFIGVIQQVPPMYSALKKNGRRLYQLAREGVEVERDARSVTV
ncbi:MAG: tRNA pseudouridine(55) synthase TruB, partial [Chloroflexi bacterium]|nr:tRNA pseudouridine(55) synthase TruB [Chloroflexota bacterium]